MEDQYRNIDSGIFEKDAEIKELKESYETLQQSQQMTNLVISTLNRNNKCGFIFLFLIILISFGLIIYLFLAVFTGIGTINNAPIGTILAWVPKPEETSSKAVSIPDGWMPCDGSLITQGQWKGGRSPDLNSIGAFLRGGTEDQVLEMEDDQIRDHDHGYYAASMGSSEGDVCGTDKAGCADPDTLVYRKFRRTESARVLVDKWSKNSGRVGSETRPINMKVMYIIRVY